MSRPLTITRASFLGLVAAGVAAPRAFGDIRDDLRVLSFALTIEYVQAALYRDALKRVPGLTAEDRRALTELRDNEVEHVDALRATITDAGGRPNDRPRVAFGDDLQTRGSFLKLANTLEDTGVSAYNGSAPAFENEDFVAAFASIVQVEGRHAAIIRALRDKPPAPLPLDKSSNQQVVRQAYGPFTVE
jgi:rubrerythrin